MGFLPHISQTLAIVSESSYLKMGQTFHSLIATDVSNMHEIILQAFFGRNDAAAT
jgi:hypothetical protein